MDILTNPYVIIFIVVAVVVSNIMALKYTANAKFGMKQKPKVGRPPLGAKPGAKPHKSMVPAPTGSTPSTIRPPPPIAKRQGANTSKMQNMKIACLPQQQSAPKPPASQKGKCVWKQLVTYW